MPGPYELHLIRHGVAEERGDAWPDDTKRPLSEEGMERLRKSARGLAQVAIPVRACVRSSSTDLPYADATFDAVITDPPYYDNVPYADLSDYFYVWHV